MKKYAIAILLISLMTSCEKEIDMDYRSINKLYVVAGYTSSSESRVTITQTSDMDEVLDDSKIDGASVTISNGDGKLYNLIQDEHGDYVSTELLASNVEDLYSLDVVINDQHFNSTSQLMPKIEITSIDIETFKMPGSMKPIFCRVGAKNVAGTDNYYKYVLYHKDERVVWGVTKKSADDLTPLSLTLFLASFDGEKVTVFKNKDRDIVDGDVISADILSIDKRSYDYLQSLMYSDNTSSNPIYNFTGGCLGYYTTYINNSISKVFELSEISGI